ncbi:hypothetical protein G9A89_010673 [Geosiphon pyriformis]|nr:hypothetical protein G9A89_010673 [Geosiphon pyriformis]
MNPASPFSRVTPLIYKKLLKSLFFQPTSLFNYPRYIALQKVQNHQYSSGAAVDIPEKADNIPADALISNTVKEKIKPALTKSTKVDWKPEEPTHTPERDSLSTKNEASETTVEQVTSQPPQNFDTPAENLPGSERKKPSIDNENASDKKSPGSAKNTNKRVIKPKTPRKKMNTKKPVLIEDEKLQELSSGLLSDLWLERTKIARKMAINRPQQAELSFTAIEALQPTEKKLSEGSAVYGRLITDLYTGFNVYQLKEYLKKKNHRVSSLKKEKLIEEIITKVWELEDPNINIVEKESVKCSAKDLYFLIGPEAETLHQIEEGANVLIRINVSSLSYTISGKRGEIAKAKKLIAQLTSRKSQELDVPSDIKVDDRAMSEILPYIQEICKNSGAYVQLNPQNKLVIYGRTADSIEYTIRLLNIAWAKPDQNENRLTLCHSKPPSIPNHGEPPSVPDHSELPSIANYGFFPVHDGQSMSLFLRHLNWWRLGKISGQNVDSTPPQKPIPSDTINLITMSQSLKPSETALKEELSNADFIKLGQFLQKYLEEDNKINDSKIELYSAFGNILFHENSSTHQNLFRPPNIPPYEQFFSPEAFSKWAAEINPTEYFLSRLVGLLESMGPSKKYLELEYVPSDQDLTNTLIRCLRIRFEVKNKELILKDVEAFKRRLLLDLLMLNMPVDIRLVAARKEILSHSKLPDGFQERCSYNSSNFKTVECPQKLMIHVHQGEIINQDDVCTLLLNQVTLFNSQNYRYGDTILMVRNTREPETGAVRFEARLCFDKTNTVSAKDVEVSSTSTIDENTNVPPKMAIQFDQVFPPLLSVSSRTDDTLGGLNEPNLSLDYSTNMQKNFAKKWEMFISQCLEISYRREFYNFKKPQNS